MRKEKFIKLNILSLILILLFTANIFADELLERLGPAIADSTNESLSPEILANVISDYEFDQSNATGKITSGEAAAISQIKIAEPQLVNNNTQVVSVTNVANPVTSPMANPINNSSNVIGPGNTTMPSNTENPLGTQNSTSNLNLSNFTTKTLANANKVETGAPTFALINATTKEIYTTKDVTTKYNPSGLVNLMTAYLGVKFLSMDSVLKVNASAIRGLDKDASIAALAAGDTITLKDAIASMFVKGCVDSSNVVAEAVSGSISEFVTLMNNTATELGLTNTKFVDPSGIGQNESTALDMSIVMAKVCEYKELIELLTLTQYTLPKVQKRDKLILYSRNTMLNKDNATYNADVKASRLAYTSASKYCIASLMQSGTNNIVAVVLKAEGQQFAATKKLFELSKTIVGENTSSTTTTTTTTASSTPPTTTSP